MKDVNRVQIIGHQGHDPAVQYTGRGTVRTTFRIAISARWKDVDGQLQETTAWTPSAARHCSPTRLQHVRPARLPGSGRALHKLIAQARMGQGGRPLVLLEAVAAFHPVTKPTALLESLAEMNLDDPATSRSVPIVIFVPGDRRLGHFHARS
jgi:hypothetical protein